MKIILIYDYFMPLAHRKLNNSFLNIVSQKYKVVVMNSQNYFESDSPNVKFLNVPLLSTRVKNDYLRLIVFIINFIIARISIIGKQYDEVLITTYETLSLGFTYKLLPHKKVFVFEHYNIDDLSKPRPKRLFKKFRNEVHHLVFAPYIKDYLCTLGVDSEKVHYIPHPLFVENFPFFSKQTEKRLILCPGNSNDEEIIKSLIYYEEKTHFLEQNNIEMQLRVSMKSPLTTTSNSINLWKGYISTEEYEKMYNEADAILVLYPTSYRYRFASVILNALTKHKVVYGNDIEIIHFFANKYPYNCKCFTSIEELFNMLKDRIDFNETECERFLNDNSNASVLAALETCLK